MSDSDLERVKRILAYSHILEKEYVEGRAIIDAHLKEDAELQRSFDSLLQAELAQERRYHADTLNERDRLREQLEREQDLTLWAADAAAASQEENARLREEIQQHAQATLRLQDACKTPSRRNYD